MAGVNKVILVGRLGADPEVRYTNSGQAIARFNIATSEGWTDKNGEKQERTEWHRVVAWGKLAELCKEYLAKGKQVYIEGRLQTRSWEKEGQKRYTTEISASTIQFLGSPGATPREAGAGRNDTVSAPSLEEKFETPSDAPSFASEDDIPF